MELVTGRAGSPHITSQQDRQKHQGIWGDGAYILATGNQLEPQAQSSNKILIKDGALMFQGAIFRSKSGLQMKSQSIMGIKACKERILSSSGIHMIQRSRKNPQNGL